MSEYKKSNIAVTLLTALLVCVLTVAVCLIIYLCDNKYTAEGPQAFNGVLTLDEQTLANYPRVFLIEGWEYYCGQLLTPQDFNDIPPVSNQYIFIGQFGGFEAGNKNASPHGSASYRLNIIIPEEVRNYTLELPEIFSAYKLYINGSQVASMGDPDPQNYRPETGNRTINVEAGKNIEILIAVSDFSHLYSGMVYPPAFGLPEAVNELLNARLFFRSVLCAVALTVGLLSMLIGFLSRKNMLAVLYGFLCVFFVGYTCYPITRTFFTGFYPQYAIENFSFCAMLAVIMLLARQVCGLKNKRSRIFILFGFFMCAAAAVSPFLWQTGNLRIMMIYSNLISVYEWITAAFITITAIRAIAKNAVRAKILFYGILILDIALIMDRLLPLYEPIITGWFIELASFALILSLGIVVGQEVAARFRETAVLTERAGSMERLYQSQQTYFTVLKQEMQESKKIRHDMRHHFMMINGFIQNSQYDKLSDYISEYQSVSKNIEMSEYCPIDVINILSHHYGVLAKKNNINFDIRSDLSGIEGEQSYVNISDTDLCCLYSNLMENALEACMRIKTGERNIRVAIVRTGTNSLTINVQNNTDDNIQANGDSFLSSKTAGRIGYGLLSIRSVAEKYNGVAAFRWDKSEKIFESSVTVIN